MMPLLTIGLRDMSDWGYVMQDSASVGNFLQMALEAMLVSDADADVSGDGASSARQWIVLTSESDYVNLGRLPYLLLSPKPITTQFRHRRPASSTLHRSCPHLAPAVGF